MSDPTARTLELLSLLQTHRHWRGAELAVRLGVSERTVRRDIDRLRELGYPVDAEPGPEGGYQLAAGARLPPLLFSDEEAIAMVVGLQAAAGAAIEGIEEVTVQVMAKLDQILPDRLRRRVDALRSSVETMRWSPSAETIAPEVLTVLSLGCRDREEIRFEYRRRDGEESRRLVQPAQLVCVGRRWYLVAWDVRRNDWRMFRADRMVAPSLAGVRFEPRPLPAENASAFVAQGLRSAVVEHRASVVVQAEIANLEHLGRRLGADVEALDDGRCRVVVRSDSPGWLASLVLMVAAEGDLVIEDAPDEVRRRVALVSRRGTAATG